MQKFEEALSSARLGLKVLLHARLKKKNISDYNVVELRSHLPSSKYLRSKNKFCYMKARPLRNKNNSTEFLSIRARLHITDISLVVVDVTVK